MRSACRRIAVAAAVVAGCAPAEGPRSTASPAVAEIEPRPTGTDTLARGSASAAGGAPPIVARAQMRPVGEGSARGTIEFRGTEGGPLVVNVMMLGLVAGAHAVHVHPSGDCAAHVELPPRPESPLADDSVDLGELGNVTAEASGLAHGSLRAKATFDRALLGQVIVVHAGPEDLIARPGGGAVVACGVIESASRRNVDRSGRPPRRLNA